jgi:hypothetical protein
MSLRAVDYYVISCDEPGCLASTGDSNLYNAWDDPQSAVEDWRNVEEGVVSDDGTVAFCHRHRDGKRCDYCGELAAVAPSGDGDFICDSCKRQTWAATRSGGCSPWCGIEDKRCMQTEECRGGRVCFCGERMDKHPPGPPCAPPAPPGMSFA